MKMTLEENKKEGFFVKYKKWIVALISLQLIPTILVLGTFFSIAIYLFINNDSNWHPYKSYIQRGYEVGVDEGIKDREALPRWDENAPLGTGPRSNIDFTYRDKTPWYIYEKETDRLKERAYKEKETYLLQFPESEIEEKRVEMKLKNIQLSLELELQKRFRTALGFYADYVKKQVDRSKYTDEKEYQQALRDKAWKVGYIHGYAIGRIDDKDLFHKSPAL